MRYYFGVFPKLEVSVPATNTHASHLRIRALCEGAIVVALAQALSCLEFMEVRQTGGSLTPCAMFPIVFFFPALGLGQGLLAGFVFGLLQLIFDGAYAWGWQSMLLDYLVAFTPLGLAGLFRGRPAAFSRYRAEGTRGPLPGPFHQRRHHLSDL
ncbi:MAG: energy-coupled thiamine transporter ThiT [Oscillospiraceae bacterium]